MSALRELARVSANVEVSTASREFSFLARALASDSDPATLAAIVERQGTPRLQRILRAGVSAGSTTDAAALSEFRTISSAWLASLQQASVFDELLTGGAKRLPLQTRCIVVSGSVVGSVPNESMVKPISSMAISAAELAPRKATAIVIATEELFKFSTPSAAQVFDTELRAGVVAATDSVFLSELFSSVVPIASLGNSPSGVMNDIESLLDAITINAASNVYFVIDPDNAKKLATMTHTDGARIFPNFGLKGGELIPGLTGLISDQLPAGAAIMIVADGLVMESEAVTLRPLRHGSVQLETSPDSPATASTLLRNLWVNDERGLIGERFFGFAIARPTAISALSGVNY